MTVRRAYIISAAERYRASCELFIGKPEVWSYTEW